jgi:hypothetical protein
MALSAFATNKQRFKRSSLLFQKTHRRPQEGILHFRARHNLGSWRDTLRLNQETLADVAA